MTRKKRPYETSDHEKALESLYGNGVRDLTYEGYNEAMSRLRQQDAAAARRVERILAPFLKDRIFPRRQREWHETSEGTRARLVLLPGNPHVQADVRSIREVLRIPPGHVHATEGDAIWQDLKHLVRPGAVRHVVEGHLAGQWLYVHRKVAVGQAVEEKGSENLSAEMRQSAVTSAGVDLEADGAAEWLRCPLGPTGTPNEIVAPLDGAASRLAERHNLPQTTVGPLTFYILTQDPYWVTKLEPLQIEVSHGDDPYSDPGAFTVSLKGIDEFITKKDWNHVWTKYVRPGQDSIWERRGMKPQGRRVVDLRRLQKVLPFYEKIVTGRGKMKDLLGRPVGELWEEESEKQVAHWDQETVRRAIVDLQQLLTPRM